MGSFRGETRTVNARNSRLRRAAVGSLRRPLGKAAQFRVQVPATRVMRGNLFLEPRQDLSNACFRCQPTVRYHRHWKIIGLFFSLTTPYRMKAVNLGACVRDAAPDKLFHTAAALPDRVFARSLRENPLRRFHSNQYREF